MAEAWVVSENVGEGGPGEDGRFGDSPRLRSERFLRGMTVDVCCGSAKYIRPFLGSTAKHLS